jgi:hypothetical protein
VSAAQRRVEPYPTCSAIRNAGLEFEAISSAPPGEPRAVDRSEDGGASWLRIDDARESPPASNIRGDANVYGRVSVSSAGRGIPRGHACVRSSRATVARRLVSSGGRPVRERLRRQWGYRANSPSRSFGSRHELCRAFCGIDPFGVGVGALACQSAEGPSSGDPTAVPPGVVSLREGQRPG